MAKYYVDFVGLNTFMYETSGWDPARQTVARLDLGSFDPVFNTIGETTTYPGSPKIFQFT